MLRIAGTMSFGDPAGERLVDRQRRIEAGGLVLREVLHHDLVAQRARAAVRRFFARQHAHQRRFAGAVRSDERDAVAALDVQVRRRGRPSRRP